MPLAGDAVVLVLSYSAVGWGSLGFVAVSPSWGCRDEAADRAGLLVGEAETGDGEGEAPLPVEVADRRAGQEPDVQDEGGG
jgi:hypothetical protein